MNPGDQLQDRWRLVERVVSRDAVERWRAIDEQTSQPVEVLLLGAERSNPEARKSFVEVHEAVRSAGLAPGVVATERTHHEGNRALAIRGSLHDATLADLRGPLDAATVAAIGARLIPAVLTAGPATRGALLPSDVGLTEQGEPILAPRGAPLTQVVRGSTRAAAPEAFGGAPTDGPAGLYGLGVLLYRLATGREPIISPTGAPPPAPSTLRHGIPDAFDAAVLRLLSRSPGDRVGALPLLQDIASDGLDLREHVQSTSPTGQVRYTSTSAVEGTPGPGEPTPAALVWLDAPHIRAATPEDRSLLAGLAGLSQADVERMADEQLPVVVQTLRTAAAARGRAAELTQQTGLPFRSSSGGGLGPMWPVAGAMVFIVPLVLLVGLFSLVAPPLVTPLLLLGVAILAAGLGLGIHQTQQRRNHGRGVASLRKQAALESSPDRLGPARRRLAELRVQLAKADLPAAASLDGPTGGHGSRATPGPPHSSE